jgi:drug/metabolite transporter (DMT)-like permease
MALVFAPIWLAAGYAFNLSLCARCQTGTSVASNTVISSTTSLWALLMSVVMLGESASVSKLAAVVLSCIGAGIIASDDKVGKPIVPLLFFASLYILVIPLKITSTVESWGYISRER